MIPRYKAWDKELQTMLDVSLIDFKIRYSHFALKIEVIDNFIGNLPGKAAWCWGNAIKYLLRFQKKNGLEDLKKARKNLDWLIEEMEHEN